MNTRADLESELTSRLQSASNSTLYPTDRITELIQNAYVWTTQLFTWRDLLTAKSTTTQLNINYYDYPDDFRTGTIFRLEVGGEEYDRVSYEDFLSYLKDNSGTTKKIFANFKRWYFINPSPSSAGTSIDIWGSYNVIASDLSEETSKTIFSDNKQEGNEAVVKKAFSVAIKRDDNKLAIAEEKDALGILSVIFKDQVEATQRDKRLDHAKFDVPDMFRNSPTSSNGSFNYRPN